MKKFFNPASILCFDGDDGDGIATGDPAATLANQAVMSTKKPDLKAGGGGNGGGKTFTQEELNAILAEDKRKHQERIKTLETDYQELLENQNLTKEQRDKLQSKLEDLQNAQLTVEQRAEREKKELEKKYQTDLKEVLADRERWETLYKQATVDRALQDAAMSADAFEPSQIVALLRPMTSLKEEEGQFVAMIDFPDISEKDGKPIKTLRTPADAVNRMRELPKKWGNLFNSNIVEGLGAGNANNAGGRDFDYSAMSPEQYRKHRNEIKERLSRR
jgi:hypothetical protein